MKSAFQPLIHLSVEVLISTLMFVVIALPALGLELAITALIASKHFQPLTINLIKFAKFFILVMDILLFLYYLVRKTLESFNVSKL